jgi:D-psicose/D-tagatose/L-ribulose 3-epimerase
MSLNRVGMHMMLYTSDWSETRARVVFERAKEFAYDFVELLIFDPETVDVEMTVRLSNEFDLPVETAVCGAPDADLSSDDPEVVARGEKHLARAVEVARDVGATLLGGPTFSAVQRYHATPSPERQKRVTESYARLADLASAAGIRMGLEALNRYESNFVNTLGQAAEIVREVGSRALFVHADLFHMNIEEHYLPATIAETADVLGYVHVAESNRGALGTGNTDWPEFFGALNKAGYSGPITFESFSPSVLGEEMTTLIALWREPWTDPDAVARDGVEFIRRHLAEAADRGEGGR